MKNKKVLVTGGTGGIGFSIVKTFLNEGAFVTYMGKTQDSVGRMSEELSKDFSYEQFDGVYGDLGEKAVYEKLFSQYEDFDILINNAGYFEQKEFEEITDEDWKNVLEVNLLSSIRISRQYFPKMLKKNWGRVIFMSCSCGAELPDGMLHYGVSKSAMLAVTEGLSNLAKGSKVTVNAILPGFTDTKGLDNFIYSVASQRKKDFGEVKENFFEEVQPQSLLGRFLQPEEIAEAILHVCQCGNVLNGATVDMTEGYIS